MNHFEKLIAAAQTLGLAEEIRAMEERAGALEGRDGVNVAVVGGVGSGKTTLVNLAVGREVRRPSLLPDGASSLRVSFERAEDDPRFECVSVVNRLWNERGATLYELNAEDGRDEALLDGMDLIFYTVPVTAAMTNTDRERLEALRGVGTVVVLTGADRLEDAGDLQRVTEYVEGVLSELPGVRLLVSDLNRPEATALRLLEAVPVESELSELRKAHAEAILRRAKERVAGAARRALADNAHEAEAAAARAETARREAAARHAEWGAVRAEFMASGSGLALKLADEVREMARPFGRTLNAQGEMEGYSGAWLKNQLPEQMQRLLREELIQRRQTIVANVRADLTKALEAARELGMNPGIVFDEADIDTVIEATQPPERANRLGRFLVSKNGLKVAAVTVAGVGGLVAALSMPTVGAAMLARMPGGVWAALLTSVSAPFIHAQRREWDRDQWQASLDKYARDNCNRAAVTLSRGVMDYYEALYGVLTNVVFPEAVDEAEALDARKAELEGILAELEA